MQHVADVGDGPSRAEHSIHSSHASPVWQTKWHGDLYAQALVILHYEVRHIVHYAMQRCISG